MVTGKTGVFIKYLIKSLSTSILFLVEIQRRKARFNLSLHPPSNHGYHGEHGEHGYFTDLFQINS